MNKSEIFHLPEGFKMPRNKIKEKKIQELVDKITQTYKGDSGINFIEVSNLPVRDKILGILELLTEILFPGYTGKRTVTKSNVDFIIIDILYHVYTELSEQIERAYKYQCRMQNCDTGDCRRMAHDATLYLLTQLPRIRDLLKGDVSAAFDGDPAAKSYEEIVISYPCITAIATYRIAHELYLKEVPLIPRIMSECAHSKTGIDIHPGARIGKNFFIDHGTGVVIGETTIIGNNVKIYQGTTLGAMSFPKDERGRIIKGQKRHPTIRDDVTIYAEATILGNVTIGKGATIGGNVWIKQSVPAGYTVTSADAALICKTPKIEGGTYEI
jgi:serine O-acetyltransferase